MERVNFIKHKGRDIIYIDFTNTKKIDEQLEIFNWAEDIIKTQTPKSVLSLINYKDARYDIYSVEAQKNYSAAITPYVKASAVTGLNSLMFIILRSVARITGRNIRVFDDLEAAKDWLVEQ